MEAVGARMVEYSIPENFRVGGRPNKWPATHRGGQIGRNRGRLLKSMGWEMRGKELRVGTNVRYAKQFHFGGTIKPVKAKALAIPAQPGSQRRPRHYGDLSYAPPVNGDSDSRGVLGRRVRRGRGKARKMTFIPLFYLRAKVEQDPRPFLLWQAEDIAYAERELVAHVMGVAP